MSAVHIPFQMHLLFLLSGALIALIIVAITGVLRVILDLSFNAPPFILAIVCYVLGFMGWYLSGHI